MAINNFFVSPVSCDITLTIVNTDNRELLRTCLKTIYATIHSVAFEVIVVDNASNDGSADMVASCFPHAIVIRNESRLGYGNSHNKAIRAARGRYILVLNEDMEIKEGAVDRMVSEAEQTPDLGAMGCRILNPDGTLQHSCFRFPALTSELFEALFPYTMVFARSPLRSKMYWWDHSSKRQVDVVLGCCMLVSRKTIEFVGAFDPNFFVYSEEHDWCKRMADAGLRNIFIPDAAMIHVGGQTSKRMSLRMALVQLDSRTKYFFKHHGALQTLALRGILLFSASMRALGWGVRLLSHGSHDAGAAAKFKEYWSSLKFIASWKSSIRQT
jgi:GT2 family glycosyltransferase